MDGSSAKSRQQVSVRRITIARILMGQGVTPRSHNDFYSELQTMYCCYCWCYCFLWLETFSPWYFSRTKGDPHPSCFKFQTAELPVLCVTCQV